MGLINYELQPLAGSRKQVEWADTLREEALKRIDDDFAIYGKELADRLPIDATWWIENRNKSLNSTFEAARLYLGLKYQTLAGANY